MTEFFTGGIMTGFALPPVSFSRISESIIFGGEVMNI